MATKQNMEAEKPLQAAVVPPSTQVAGGTTAPVEHPVEQLPETGGSYTRNADGSLSLQARTVGLEEPEHPRNKRNSGKE